MPVVEGPEDFDLEPPARRAAMLPDLVAEPRFPVPPWRGFSFVAVDQISQGVR